jgi:enterochelin esterase family protein
MERDDGGWVLTRSYPLDARDEYCYIVDGRWILDPLNPFQGPGGFGPRSECRMPAYRPPRPMEPPVDGRMERCRLGGRLVDVYVPAQVEKAALLVVQDGGDYIRFTGMPGLIDALIREGAIAPTLAVFVSPRNREVEYHPNDRYVAWLAERVVPSLVRRYGIDPDPGRHGLVGASLGGSIATHGALTRPDVFRLVGAQSPAYRLAAHDGGTLGVGGDIDGSALRFHIDGGTLEMMLHGREFLPAIRRGVKVLRERGCVVQYTEVNEGHNWTNWRGRLPRLLTWLLG